MPALQLPIVHCQSKLQALSGGMYEQLPARQLRPKPQFRSVVQPGGSGGKGGSGAKGQQVSPRQLPSPHCSSLAHLTVCSAAVVGLRGAVVPQPSNTMNMNTATTAPKNGWLLICTSTRLHRNSYAGSLKLKSRASRSRGVVYADSCCLESSRRCGNSR